MNLRYLNYSINFPGKKNRYERNPIKERQERSDYFLVSPFFWTNAGSNLERKGEEKTVLMKTYSPNQRETKRMRKFLMKTYPIGYFTNKMYRSFSKKYHNPFEITNVQGFIIGKKFYSL